MAQPIREELLPTVMPCVVLGQVAVVSNALEAELAIWRFFRVQGGQLPTERVGIRNSLREITEIAEVKVRVSVAFECSPSDGLGTKVGRDGVNR